MSAVVLVFGLPMILAAALISPSALHNLVHGWMFYAVVAAGLPFIAWQTFLTVFAFPSPGTGRMAAVLKLWLGGIVMVAAVFNLLIAMGDYSLERPGLYPKAGFLLAGFVICMLVSCGLWGGFARILPREVALGGALVTGCLLFAVVATLGYLLAG